jgi:predicted nucleic acid-binding protein
MIVADTNVWIAYWTGERAGDTDLLDSALEQHAVAMAPMVVSELLSDPALPGRDRHVIVNLPMMEILPGYWNRVGDLRASLFVKHMRPKLVDSMIAQICIDHTATLLTRDTRFQRFTEAGLKLQT